jgi:hypothetical protein
MFMFWILALFALTFVSGRETLFIEVRPRPNVLLECNRVTQTERWWNTYSNTLLPGRGSYNTYLNRNYLILGKFPINNSPKVICFTDNKQQVVYNFVERYSEPNETTIYMNPGFYDMRAVLLHVEKALICKIESFTRLWLCVITGTNIKATEMDYQKNITCLCISTLESYHVVATYQLISSFGQPITTTTTTTTIQEPITTTTRTLLTSENNETICLFLDVFGCCFLGLTIMFFVLGIIIWRKTIKKTKDVVKPASFEKKKKTKDVVKPASFEKKEKTKEVVKPASFEKKKKTKEVVKPASFEKKEKTKEVANLVSFDEEEEEYDDNKQYKNVSPLYETIS